MTNGERLEAVQARLKGLLQVSVAGGYDNLSHNLGELIRFAEPGPDTLPSESDRDASNKALNDILMSGLMACADAASIFNNQLSEYQQTVLTNLNKMVEALHKRGH